MSVDFPEPVRPARRIVGVLLALSARRSGTGGGVPRSILEAGERSGYEGTLALLEPGDGRGGTEVAVYTGIFWPSTWSNAWADGTSLGGAASMI